MSEPTAENDHTAMRLLADLLDFCEPEDEAPVTWGSLRRQVRAAAEGSSGD